MKPLPSILAISLALALGASADIYIDGKQRTIESTAVFDGTFTSGSNFTVFGGLTAPSITITGNTTSAGRSAINGLQIIGGDLAVLDIASFTASGLFVAPGTSVRLDWEITGADRITLDPGMLDVTGTTTTDVTVNEETTYTITVNGTITREITVTVNQPVLIAAAGFNGSGEFEVTGVNLVEGRQYDLFYSFDLASFTPIGSAVTADGSGTATFVDVLANPINEPVFFYRVGEVGNPLIP